MSITGVCQLCDSTGAQFGCDRCGAVVCQAHYDSQTGFCTECASEVRGGPGESGPR